MYGSRPPDDYGAGMLAGRTPDEGYVLAVDIGGTKLAAGVVGHDGTIVSRGQTPTAGGSAEALFEKLRALVDDVRVAASARGAGELSGCGVGCGGPMTSGGREVSPLNIVQWRGFPLQARMAACLDLPVWVDNDAKAMALGEGWRGAGAGCRNFGAMVVSTGVGGGLVVDGRLLDGASGNAGHIGHLIVEPDGRLCSCGARGCLEAEASGSAIAAITGRPPREASAEVIERTGRLVGRAVASVVSLLDLELVAVAGSVALGFGDPFFAAANAELAERARLDYTIGARIVRAGLGADAPLIGAAALAWQHLGAGIAG